MQFKALLLASFAVYSVHSFAFYRDAIPNGHNVQHPCNNDKIWFGVGHHSDQGGNERNAFGLDFKAAGYTWTRDLCTKDSDSDGRTNGEELGDPLCLWQRGQTPQRTGNVTHPGFKTPVANFPYDSADTTTLDCSTFFKTCSAFSDPDVRYIDLRARNDSNDSIVPAQETTYYNMNFELPSDQEYHAIGFEPLLDNLNVIHHFVITSCQDPVPTDRGYESFNQLPGCEETMYIWSFGLGVECMPMQAGVAFGRNNRWFVQVQLHWTNPQLRSDYRDTSGVRIHYTPKLRKYKMGMLWLGQQDLLIPPQQSSVINAGTCSAGCTNALLDQGPIYLTSAFPHMHLIGKSMLVDHEPAKGHRTRIMDDKVYNYNSPVVYQYGPNFIPVEAGDVFHTSCEFNSMSRNKTTRWGFGSYEEMCYAFIRYFPRRGELMCTQYQSFDICYSQSYVDGPRCSFFAYNENITQTVNHALDECDAVINEVQQPTPATTPVCTPMCKTQIQRVLQAYQNPCQQTRHKKEWELLNGLLQPRIGTLTNVLQHCSKSGTIGTGNPLLGTQPDSGSGAPSLTASVSMALLLPTVFTMLASH